jgi:hypothetical protein
MGTLRLMAVRMHSNAEYYRRLGLVAKERAAHATDLSLKKRSKTLRGIGWRLLNELIG